MLEQLFIDKGDSCLAKSRDVRGTEPLHSLKLMYLAKDYYVRAMLENDVNVRYKGYANYKELQKESWDFGLSVLGGNGPDDLSKGVGLCGPADSEDSGVSDSNWVDNAIVTSDYVFDDIVGYDYIKEKFKVHMIYPMTRDMPFKINSPNTILMYGPPGCGKTFFVGALSNELPGGSVYYMDASNILSKYYGETSRNLGEIFSKVKENKNNVLFIDEVDALSMTRDSNDPVSNRTLSTLLTQIDGIDKSDINLIAATNRPDLIDSALLSRFNSMLYIGPPGKKEKMFIFELEMDKQIEGHTPDLVVKDIVHYMEDKEAKGLRYSGRDIRRIVTNVLELAAIDYVVNGSFCIDNKMFYQMIDESMPGISSEGLGIYDDFGV
ncbi:MAG: ATP-binding protein [Candidatus Aenigmarchaeota archaeon]|nr:ATP-binding protein [Candidatus Aenigmarchaeota archaeon]